MDAKRKPRIILAHDWLTGMRGGEKCLEVLCERWPEAKLFTLLHRKHSVSKTIEQLSTQTSFLDLLPNVHRYYRYLLPIMPLATRSWRVPACELIVSFSHCVAKAIRVPRGTPHICYCFTPMRYAWHMQDSYFNEGRLGRLKAWLVRGLLTAMREWDKRNSDGVTHFIAISKTIQKRIEECYNRSSTVIYPPVDTEFYYPAAVPREDYYLVVSAFAPYKRIDLVIEAANQMRRRVVVIGTGQDQARLQSLAGPTVEFLGWQPNEVIRDHLRRCRALLFPGEEDFGIVPLEAQACGAPVIAYGQGGVTETVIPPGSIHEPTGLWFEEQTTESLAEAMLEFERQARHFSPHVARRQAERFDRDRFQRELYGYCDRVMGTAPLTVRRAA